MRSARSRLQKPDNRRWSITAVKGSDNRGELLGYADEVGLVDARMVVKESRRQVIAAGGHREVCGGSSGSLPILSDRPATRLRSGPTVARCSLRSSGEDITRADAVRFDRRAQMWM